MIYSAYGQRVELRYAPNRGRSLAPHTATGRALRMAHGRGPHNVLVVLDDGRKMIVPHGNVRTARAWS